MGGDWQRCQNTGFAISTGKTSEPRQSLCVEWRVPANMVQRLESEESPHKDDVSATSKPTYSQVRNSHHVLAEMRYHDQYFQTEAREEPKEDVVPGHMSRFMDIGQRSDRTAPRPRSPPSTYIPLRDGGRLALWEEQSSLSLEGIRYLRREIASRTQSGGVDDAGEGESSEDEEAPELPTQCMAPKKRSLDLLESHVYGELPWK